MAKQECLQGNGLRQGTRCVLNPDGQEKVFSHGMTHKGCPAQGGKGGMYYLHCSYNVLVMIVKLLQGGGGGKAKQVL